MADKAEKDTSTEKDEKRSEEKTEDRIAPTGTLNVEDREAKEEARSYDEIIVESIRAVKVGETRSLASAGNALSPTQFSTQLFQGLRASSIALASGIPVITTDREKIVWPKLSADVGPAFYSEGGTIAPGDPTFVQISSEPQKIAHIVVCSNEVIDDSEPPVVQVLTSHLDTMMALKLDSAVYVGGTALPGITGMNNVSGAQVGGTITTAGTAGNTSYPQLMRGVGLLRAANAPEPYVLACHPNVRSAFDALQDTTGQSVQPPPNTPPFYNSTQINAGTAYLYSPSQFAIVRRQDSSVEVDRSRLFNSDQSEIRGKIRANLIAPNPTAIVKVFTN